MSSHPGTPVADPFHPPPDPQWLALHTEAALEPGLPIIDAHHHLFDRPARRYAAEDLLVKGFALGID